MLSSLIVSGGFFISVLFVFCFVSFWEKEKRAGLVFLFFALGILVFFGLPLFVFPFVLPVFFYLSLALVFGMFVLFLPIDFRKKQNFKNSAYRIDERDIMFSRNELKPGTEQFDSYYSGHPQKKVLDDKFRAKAGLLSPKSSRYNALAFTAADSSFETIELFKEAVHKKIVAEKQFHDPKVLSRFVLNWAKKLGAVDAGICEMQDYHWYSYKGRGEEYGNEIKPEHKFGIAFTVEMSQEMIDAAPSASVIMESAQQYLDAGRIAIQIAKFIQNLGWDARAHIDGNYKVVCPLVARDAGFGEIGRMGLLMTPQLGPRVRIAVVTSNIPLEISSRKEDFSVTHFCEICKKCAEVCPSKAISFNKRELINGSFRWQINSESCFTYWCILGTDCGRCMSVCPYSHPNNLMHNVIRWGIRKSFLFRYFALKMDDLIYGRHPKEKKQPNWIG
jgi:reductive dehalogenase